MLNFVFGVDSQINIGAEVVEEDEKMAWSANHSIWARAAVFPDTMVIHGYPQRYASHTS